ncbi:MAG: aminoacetone oxidase family FAD-binding enzyme [Coriobacteriia bacterium]
MMKPKIAIMGGGAAGLSAAIVAARAGAKVVILEAKDRVGKKILATGNGRCNLTNMAIEASAYNRPEFVEPVLSQYPCEAVREFFGNLGLLTYADEEGRVYPITNSANSVLDVLRLECRRLGVEEQLGFLARYMRLEPEGFEIVARKGERAFANAVVVTTGGDGEDSLNRLGHERIPAKPVLCPIRTETPPIRGLSGVRVACSARLLDDNGAVLDSERGELLFRDHGVSGIMVFDLSRFLEHAHTLVIDFFPDIAAEQLSAMLAERQAKLGWRSAEEFFIGMLHSRVAQAILRAAELDAQSSAAELSVEKLAALLKGFRLQVEGKGDIKQAQVMRGGAVVAGFDPQTLESRIVPRVFAAGEVLDVDGRCGGFNLHWAWASGIAAGEAAAASVRRIGGAE